MTMVTGTIYIFAYFYADTKETCSVVYFAFYPGYLSGPVYLLVTNKLYVHESGPRRDFLHNSRWK
jgi:hypothetical protein